MSLFDRLKNDNKRMLTEDMASITLTNASNIPLVGKGRYTSPGATIDVNGIMVVSKKYTVAFHIDNFASITGDKENYAGWKATFVNNNGKTITGTFLKPIIDETYGYVVTELVTTKTATV